MTLADIMNMEEGDIMSLSDSELRLAIRVASAAANKRLKRLEDAGYNSPAYQGAMRSGGKFGINTAIRATDNETQQRARLVNELRRVRKFLEAETSTVKGSKQWEQNVRDDFDLDEDYTPDQAKTIIELITGLYQQLKDERPDLVNSLRPSTVYDIIRMEIDMSTEPYDEVDIYNKVVETLEGMMEE